MFLISLTLLVVFLPLQLYILYLNLSYPRHPYSWTDVHGPSWSQIILVPTGGQVAFDRWIRVTSGFIIFLFFGIGRDALDMYCQCLVKIGLARVFPSLGQPRHAHAATSTGGGALGSLSSRARMIFRKGSQATTTTASQ